MADLYLWLADAWEDRPWVSLAAALVFAALVVGSVVVFGF